MAGSGRLDGKIAIITGAAQGMGAEHARVFVAEGARVVLTDLQEETGKALAAELGANALFVRHDVSRAEDWDAVIAATRTAFGPANVLINNAAMYFICPVDEADPERVRKLLDVNIFGSWLGISKLAPVMREAGGGSIINLSSLAGMRGIPWHGIYGTSKWAIRGLTKTAAYDLGPSGIRRRRTSRRACRSRSRRCRCTRPGTCDTSQASGRPRGSPCRPGCTVPPCHPAGTGSKRPRRPGWGRCCSSTGT